jgi:hypothetical protein
MVVEIEEQLAVLTQPLLEPGALFFVEFDDLVDDGPLGLAHRSTLRVQTTVLRS